MRPSLHTSDHPPGAGRPLHPLPQLPSPSLGARDASAHLCLPCEWLKGKDQICFLSVPSMPNIGWAQSRHLVRTG